MDLQQDFQTIKSFLIARNEYVTAFCEAANFFYKTKEFSTSTNEKIKFLVSFTYSIDDINRSFIRDNSVISKKIMQETPPTLKVDKSGAYINGHQLADNLAKEVSSSLKAGGLWSPSISLNTKKMTLPNLFIDDQKIILNGRKLDDRYLTPEKKYHPCSDIKVTYDPHPLKESDDFATHINMSLKTLFENKELKEDKDIESPNICIISREDLEAEIAYIGECLLKQDEL